MKTARNKPAPQSKDFIDRLIAPLDIKQSLEMRAEISRFMDFWIIRAFGVWVVLVIACILTIQGWSLFASWGYCSDLDPDSYLGPFMVFYALALPIVAWGCGYSAINNRLMRHVKDIAGVEDDQTK